MMVMIGALPPMMTKPAIEKKCSTKVPARVKNNMINMGDLHIFLENHIANHVEKKYVKKGIKNGKLV